MCVYAELIRKYLKYIGNDASFRGVTISAGFDFRHICNQSCNAAGEYKITHSDG